MDWTLYIIGFISSSSHIYSLVLLHIIYYMLHIYNKLYAPRWLFLLGVGGTDIINSVQISNSQQTNLKQGMNITLWQIFWQPLYFYIFNYGTVKALLSNHVCCYRGYMILILPKQSKVFYRNTKLLSQ